MIIELLNEKKELAYEKAFVIRRDVTLPLRFLPCPQGKKVTICYVRIDNKILFPLFRSLVLRDTDALNVTMPLLEILGCEMETEN